MANFNEFNLDQRILKTLEEIGYTTPTPVQEQAIPKGLEGMDLIVSAQTGTGKTAAFMLPSIHKVVNSPREKVYGPQILVLVPTRELAMQVAKESEKFSKNLNLKTVCIYGGVPYPIQKRSLSRPYQILVATPGRLIDHMQQGRIDLSKLKTLVLDEADRMLDMGFVEAVEEIASKTPDDRQTMLFSATLDPKILNFSKKLQKDPFEIRVKIDLTTRDNIEQRLYYVDNIGHKMRLLDHLIEKNEIEQAIVFTATINQADEIADRLKEQGLYADSLHGNMNQRQRTRTIDKLRRGNIQFLVATDVAARGIDIATLSHVFNVDLPFQAEDYVHRIGRTGRAGAKGVAITFATYKESDKLAKINKLIGNSINEHTAEGFEPKTKPAQKAAPKGKSGGKSWGQKRFSNDRGFRHGPAQKGSPARFGAKRSSGR